MCGLLGIGERGKLGKLSALKYVYPDGTSLVSFIPSCGQGTRFMSSSASGPAASGPVSGDSAAVSKLAEARRKIVEQLSQVIVGQQHVIDELLISLFSRSHCLLEGVPGLAKTLMISTLARTLDLSFSRIQFTLDF